MTCGVVNLVICQLFTFVRSFYDEFTSLRGRNITDLRYADDTALIADNPTSMRRSISTIDTTGKKVNHTRNAKKTRVLHVANKNIRNQHTIFVDTTPLENVEDFKYLGSIKSHDGTSSKDIKTRIGMAKNRMVQLNNNWKDHGIPKSL